MSQVEEHQLARCPKCKAEQGQPCTTNSGKIADKVHYGRPYWSGQVGYQAPDAVVEHLQKQARQVVAEAPTGVWLLVSQVVGHRVGVEDPYPCICWRTHPVTGGRIPARDCGARYHTQRQY